MHIEKLYHKQFKYALPGIVEALLGSLTPDRFEDFGIRHINTYFDNVVNILKNNNVYVGTQYGSTGIELTDFLLTEPTDDTLFELYSSTFNKLPNNLQQQLRNRNDVILQDHQEVSYALNKHDDMRYASGEAFGIPIWLMSTIAQSSTHSFYMSPAPGLAMCLVNKPRKFRLDMLEELYQQDLLDLTTWTLSVTLPINELDTSRITNWASFSSHPFVERFKDLLPKTMYIEHYRECVWLPQQLTGSHQWYISCETSDTVHFATEKTFKAFLGCMAPLTVAPAGFNKHLEAMGFQLPGNYDHLDGIERIQAIAQIIKTDNTDYTDLIKHNYNLITDKQAISELIVNRIIKEYKL